MKYRLYFVLFLIFFPAQALMAAGERYRVEVLVLTHLEHSEQPAEVHFLSNYSDSQDLTLPEPEPLQESCLEEEILLPEADASMESEEMQSQEGTTEEALEPDPNRLEHVTEMGPEMQDAWRRLRLSGPFRPLQYLAWEQGSEAPFPSLRIHDETVVLTDDPYSDLRENPGEAAAAMVQRNVAASEPGDCPPADPADNLPEPTIYYALDGSVSLVRTRFLHLDLDLQLREAMQGAETQVQDRGAARRFEYDMQQQAGFRVHELKQRRQVRSARMEYFDGPVIGVLVWVTTIPLEDTEER